MNILPINSTSPYQELSAPVAQKSVEKSDLSASPFRAWTRAAGKILAAASIASALPSSQSSEVFWAQWSGKKWRTL